MSDLDINLDTFSIPSDPVMLMLLAIFSGKTIKAPLKLIKDSNDFLPEDKKRIYSFIDEIIKKEFNYATGEELKYAILSDSPKIRAETKEYDNDLFNIEKIDIELMEYIQAQYIKKAFGIEGLRHFLALLIGLYERYNENSFIFTIDEHLDRLGYKKKKYGSYDIKLRETASQIVKLFTSLWITMQKKYGSDKERIVQLKLFSVSQKELIILKRSKVIRERIVIRAEDWYKKGFNTYTKVLKRVVRENHQKNPLTIFLAPMFDVFWRINEKGKSFALKNLMEWCNMNISGRYTLKNIKDLEIELDYMKDNDYLGQWSHNGENKSMSKCKDPMKIVMNITPPIWLSEEIKKIKEKKNLYVLPAEEKQADLSTDEFNKCLKKYIKNGGTQKSFAEKLGVSPSYVNKIKNGKREITSEISDKIRTVFSK